MYIQIGDFPKEKILAIYTVKDRGDWLYRDGGGKGLENYRALSETLQIPLDQMIRPLETHTANISVVTKITGGDGILRESKFEQCDGFITHEKNLALCLLQSDCVPVYFYDPQHQAVGLIHSGRRGTEKNIVGNAIKMLYQTYGSSPDQLQVLIGPHICGKCYEVDEKTAKIYSSHFPMAIRQQIVHNNGQRITLDLQEAILYQLIEKGIKRENISLSKLCTLEEDSLFSYRGGDDYLSSLSLIMLKDTNSTEDEKNADYYEEVPSKARKIMEKALSYLGMTDKPLGSNRIIFNTDYYDGTVVEGDIYPWCVTFLWDIFKMCGLSEIFYDGEKTDDCDELLEWAQKRSLLIDQKDSRHGDILIYDWNHNGEPDHTGFLWKNNHDGTYLTIEGNTSGLTGSSGGHVSFKCRYEADILAAIRPHYE